MRLLFILYFVLISFVSFAQKVRVFDKETGKTVKNVTVFNTSKTISLTTNKEGEVMISTFKVEEKIIFSHVSYARFSIKKSRLKTLKFLLIVHVKYVFYF